MIRTLLIETFSLLDCLIHTATDSVPQEFIWNSGMSKTFNNGWIECTVDTSSSQGSYTGIYWDSSTTTRFGLKLGDFLGKSFRWDLDFEIDDSSLNQNHWSMIVYGYRNSNFYVIAQLDNYMNSSGTYSIDFDVPNDTERLWIRLNTNNRYSAYTCKTRDWRIYLI